MDRADFDLEKITEGKEYFPSPQAWEEQILYFLLVDRFNDGEEYPLYNHDQDYENALQSEETRNAWENSGSTWNGGNLEGLIEKLDYLEELGITGIWISPVLKQAPFADTYHGYGIQNFLEVDPHFGTREDLKMLTEEAHKRDILVILDVILNHAGDVFSYKGETPSYDGSQHPVEGFRDESGQPSLNPESPDFDRAWPDGGVWPAELFELETFSRKGYITDWDDYPEYIEGDFHSLKNIDTGSGELENFRASKALEVLTKCYKYWIAYADLDGFRLDTVKHLFPGATRYFVTEIHEFAHTLGKKNFYIIGEITGGMEFARDMCRKTGLNAALGINRIPENLEKTAKGYQKPEEYFSKFKNTQLMGEDEYKWYKNNVITMFDDHDMVYKQNHKERFCADRKTAPLLKNAIFLNLFTPGIPCIYYGTEQGFDGEGDRDKYVREAMFGGDFGAFRTTSRNFFDENSDIYQEMSELASLRNEHSALQMGRQYLREISHGSDNSIENFQLPGEDISERYEGIIGWSRIFSQVEYLLAVNSNLETGLEAKIMIDSDLNQPGEHFKCLYSSNSDQKNDRAEIRELDPENYFIKVSVPARGRVIYKTER